MLFDEALQYLLSLGHETLAIKLGLENTERLLSALGQPHEAFSKVQIAGTNGKGSTAVMLEAITRAAHVQTGLYTSPHLVNITERIRLNGCEIEREEFARLTTLVREAAERLRLEGRLPALPTFFEHVTAIALVAFERAQVQLAILETGLGGRLDSTTAARARIIALTPISLDHQEYLGHTLAEIAAEKAAIIRPGVTAVIAPQAPAALEVILQRCAEQGVKPLLYDVNTQVVNADSAGRLRVTFETRQDRYENVRLGLLGRHQVTNAALALQLAETLREHGFHLPRAALIEGLENARHAGRLELLTGPTPILLDGAHNVAGARALLDYLEEFVSRPVTLIFGAMRDKDLKDIAATLFPAAERLILTRPDNPRAASAAELAQAMPSGFDSSRITLTDNLSAALRAAQEQTQPGGIICLTGSLYLVGEAQSILRREPDSSLHLDHRP